MQIASYHVGVGFRINQTEMRKIDATLKKLETKLKAFTKKIDKSFKLSVSGFTIDQKKLDLAVSRALKLSSRNSILHINNFTIDQASLNAAMTSAMRRASVVASRAGTLRPDVNTRGTGGEGIRSRHVVGAGGIGGLAARMYAPALTLGLGGYGLGALNRRNQEVISAQLTTQAVTEAAGLRGVGPQAFDWLRQQGNRIGFNYMDVADSYNNFLSNALGSGMSLTGAQDIFQGFSEYGRAMGITPARNKLVMNALSQMLGKGAVSMEELKRQMAESMPGTMDVFATAYQQMTGGKLTGQEALAALYQAVPTGNVKSAEILPFVQKILRERAAPKLDIAMKTSQAQQARFGNVVSDTAMLASRSGVESGFARLFKAMTASLKEAAPLVESMARGFDRVSKGVSTALLTIQSFQRFFQGRDSFIGDMLFPDEESQKKAFIFLETFKTFLKEIGGLLETSYNGWKQIFDLLESNSIIDKLTQSITAVSNLAGGINKLASGDTSGAMEMLKDAGKGYVNKVTSVGRFGANKVLAAGQYALAGIDPRVTVDQITPYQIPSPFSTDVDWATKYKAEQARMSAESRNKYPLPGITQPLAAGQKTINLKVDMSVDIKAANPEDFNQQWQDKFKAVLEETMVQYTEKE